MNYVIPYSFIEHCGKTLKFCIQMCLFHRTFLLFLVGNVSSVVAFFNMCLDRKVLVCMTQTHSRSTWIFVHSFLEARCSM